MLCHYIAIDPHHHIGYFSYKLFFQPYTQHHSFQKRTFDPPRAEVEIRKPYWRELLFHDESDNNAPKEHQQSQYA